MFVIHVWQSRNRNEPRLDTLVAEDDRTLEQIMSEVRTPGAHYDCIDVIKATPGKSVLVQTFRKGKGLVFELAGK